MSWNKLVRDRISGIIAADGKSAVTRVLGADEYRAALRDKLLEECSELLDAGTDEIASEAADVLEVIFSYCSLHDMTEEQILAVREHRGKERGCFNDRVLLIETH